MVDRCYLRSLPFYVGRRVVLVGVSRETQFEDSPSYREFLLSVEEFFEQWKEDRRIFCVVNRDSLPEFKDYFLVAEKRKYVVITNRPLSN